MNFSTRLKTVLGHNKLKIREFSDLTGIPYSSCQSYLNGTRELGMEVLTTICLQLYVNLNWLLTGQGEMFINNNTELLTKEEAGLIDDYRHMNEQGKAAVTTSARAMAQQELFKKNKVS